jgi:hypothetical protein
MKRLKTFTISIILLAALFAIGRSASASPLAASGIAFINGVFASGSGAGPMSSTNYQMQAVVGEAGLPGNATNLTSDHYQHQPGFLASISTPTPTPTITLTPTITTIVTPTASPTATVTPTSMPTCRIYLPLVIR